MPHTYRNKNTGQEVTFNDRSKRLDGLTDNWEIVEENTLAVDRHTGLLGATAAPDGVLRRGHEESTETVIKPEPSVAPESASDEQSAPTGPDSSERSAETDGRPANGASKAEWVAYASRQAQDSDEETEIKSMTKADLISQYGGE